MMKKHKGSLALLLAMLMGVSSLAGCSSAKKTEETQKATEKPATVAAAKTEEAATEAEQAVEEAVTEALKAAEEAGAEAVNAAEEATSEAVETAAETATEAVNAAEKAATEAVETAKETATEAVNAAEEAMTEAVETAAEEAATKAVEAVKEAATEVIETAAEEAATEAVETAEEAATEAVETAEEAATEALAAEGETEAATEDEDGEYEDRFSQWNEDAPALTALIDYVEAVTDESSPDFIPVEDRIAVFDMDGTLIGELYPTYLEYYMLAWRILKDPSFEPDEEMLEVGRTLRDCALDNSFPKDMPMQHAIQAARAYAGMTLNEFSDFVTEILLRDADGFEGMTYGEAYYLPMVEVIEYLQENDFKCYVVSGSDRFICRTFIEGMVDIPYENVIGMDVALEATGQGDVDGLDYVYTTSDELVRTDKLLIKNLKTNKVLQIARDIGHQPVLSFGNSSGDVSMHNYTIGNNPYRSAAFMLIADDEVRDYGNKEKAAGLREEWEASGYEVISMANDWKTIYGDNVKKTGSFHWMEELAEDSTEEATEDASEMVSAE